MRSLFPKKVSVKEIEREVTEQWETMVRSGKNPPPASWTLLGGLRGEDRPADGPAPVTRSAVEVDEPVAEEQEEEAQAPAATAEAEPPVKPKRTRSASSSRARSTGTRASSPRPKRASAPHSTSGTRSRSS